MPSGVNACTASAPGCHVSRTGAPPVTGTVKTSTLPSYDALNAMVFPSGENTGIRLAPVVGRQPPHVGAAAIGDKEVAAVDERDVRRADRRLR